MRAYFVLWILGTATLLRCFPFKVTTPFYLIYKLPFCFDFWVKRRVWSKQTIFFYCGRAQLSTDPCSFLFFFNQFAVAVKKRKRKLFRFSAMITSGRSYFADLFALFQLLPKTICLKCAPATGTETFRQKIAHIVLPAALSWA